MAREIRTPHFGGREWPLRYTGPDGVEIKRRLGKKPRQAMDEDLLPIQDGSVYAANVDIHTLATLLELGISHDPADVSGRKKLVIDNQEITYAVVLDWLTEYMATASLLPLAKKVQEALYLSGVMGAPLDLEEVRKREALLKLVAKADDEPEPSAEGKAQTTEPTPSTVTP